MFKSVIVFAVLLVVKVLATPVNMRSIPLVPVNELEEGCVRQGGMCTHHADCDPNDIAGFGELCPQQSHIGVVCCYL